MKIGILTFHLGLNHGGSFQVYFMILALRELGYEAEVSFSISRSTSVTFQGGVNRCN